MFLCLRAFYTAFIIVGTFCKLRRLRFYTKSVVFVNGAAKLIKKYEALENFFFQISLIAFPNAGKSSLLQSVTRARPKVASYPFTTLSPYLGVIPFSDYRKLIVADLPGLIQGAHVNRGLGHAFLRHSTRCLSLLFVVDLAQPWPQPLDELYTLRDELRKYSETVAQQRVWAIAANKIDLKLAQENLPLLLKEADKVLAYPGEHQPFAIVPISAMTGEGTPRLVEEMRKLAEEGGFISDEDDL